MMFDNFNILLFDIRTEIIIVFVVNNREDNLRILQECISSLLASHAEQPYVIGLLTALVSLC